MALTGYCFDDIEDIERYTEDISRDDLDAAIEELHQAEVAEKEVEGHEGASSFTLLWSLKISKRYSPAWVVVGFAEREPERQQFFNSALVVNYALRQCHIVRKVLLWPDDKRWANKEQDMSGIEYNYQYRDLEFPRLERQIRCGIAICMDIQYPDLDKRFEKERKCADFQIANKTELCIFIAAWGEGATHKLWMQSVQPIAESALKPPFYFIACNRVGTERKTKFAGKSACFQLIPNPSVVGETGSEADELIMTSLSI